ncbi:acyl carrier protein [Phycicoccus flavus]|uniref:Acyl carrier protein n=1 Tax=Phycicoccus flavus TaxID=2502783 RepID=A0A8T6R2J8_9MICO|nr:acyl carrier protein [Phycicoccus flavus]NHA67710.1 acyl carrier protein [Phycicoccus flavus]
MTDPSTSPGDRALAVVRATVATTLDLPVGAVGAVDTLVDALGASSFDLVEILFRLEEAFGLDRPFDDLADLLRGELPAGDFSRPDGRVTDAGRARLAAVLPPARADLLPDPVPVADLPGIATVGALASALERHAGVRPEGAR